MPKKPKTPPTQRARSPEKITFRKGSRPPTLCTPALTRQVAVLVATGLTIPVACEAVGLKWVTARDWLGKGREGIEPYTDFVAAMSEAKAAFEALAVREISVAGRTDWKAKAWLLERRAAQRWRPPSQRQEVTGKDGQPLAMANLTNDQLIALASKADENDEE